MNENATLVKFGEYKHIRQLQSEGLLYMNNLPYFQKIEDNELRGDKFDGIAHVRRGNSGIVVPKDELDKPLTVTKWVIRQNPPQPEKINIFCMCAVHPLVGSFLVDEGNLRFGEHALILQKPQEFIDRVSSYLKSEKITHKANLVEYVSNDYRGEIGPFRKLMNFTYQSEWRLVCFNGPGNVREIRIGSIKDISVIAASSEVNERLRVLLK